MTESIVLWPDGAPQAAGREEEDCPRLELYPLAGEGPHPAVVICPGGGYQRRAPHEGEPVARWLNAAGIAAFVLHYRVAPYRYPSALQDARRAIRLVRHHAADWGVDPARVGILGFSAGGHLAAATATGTEAEESPPVDAADGQSGRPDVQVLAYPVISFGEFRHQGSLDRLLGPEPEETLVRQLSAENRVTGDTPPAFLWHTADDASVPVENSLLYAMALGRSGVPYELHVFPSGRHGLGLAGEHPHAAQWTGLCERWLRQQGF
ncbi:acetylesterase [Paenibacillus sp. J31TS4]|uniref:alpha/beta hydrolase n=1 Tax=Paenibacillus sp. J31TS4 TaxID=2807195 RepID=UPI001B126211|nr:alpha/beta hydrolase [Paenibacillus sp. J31TS4]GIP39912.1 acetylesterase [Paenibacillus sp. J31TS4]